METENSQPEVAPFSHEILDDEAAKISQLILSIQEKCMRTQEHVGDELFQWADEFRQAGRMAEAEFLYLHVIGIMERKCKPEYPFIFRTLRDYACSLLERSRRKQSVLLSIEPAAVLASVESNAA